MLASETLQRPRLEVVPAGFPGAEWLSSGSDAPFIEWPARRDHILRGGVLPLDTRQIL